MSWGIPVPDDSSHVMYVWFDALVNYISTLGWPEDQKNFEKFWAQGTPTQYCGKDNTRFQSVMWQAMLLAADLPHSHTIVVNGFITSGGQKMSKSLGNVINPYDVVKEFGIDALRYFVARELSTFEDSDFTIEKFKEAYNAGLANGIGNLASRVIKMSETHIPKAIEIPAKELPKEYLEALEKFEIKNAADFVWKEITSLDQYIQETQPFKLVKENKEAGVKIVTELIVRLSYITDMLLPFLPETTEKIKAAIKANKAPAPLFARK
jgi:methionyl-tRNA synthetase